MTRSVGCINTPYAALAATWLECPSQECDHVALLPLQMLIKGEDIAWEIPHRKKGLQTTVAGYAQRVQPAAAGLQIACLPLLLPLASFMQAFGRSAPTTRMSSSFTNHSRSSWATTALERRCGAADRCLLRLHFAAQRAPQPVTASPTLFVLNCFRLGVESPSSRFPSDGDRVSEDGVNGRAPAQHAIWPVVHSRPKGKACTAPFRHLMHLSRNTCQRIFDRLGAAAHCLLAMRSRA